MQLQSKLAGGKQVTRFIDRQALRATLLNEGYTCFTVRFYVAFLLQGSADLAVAFEGHMPRLPVVHATYAGVQAVMDGEPEAPTLTQSRYDAATSVGRRELQLYRAGLTADGKAAGDSDLERVPYSVLLWRNGVVSPYGGGTRPLDLGTSSVAPPALPPRRCWMSGRRRSVGGWGCPIPPLPRPRRYHTRDGATSSTSVGVTIMSTGRSVGSHGMLPAGNT